MLDLIWIKTSKHTQANDIPEIFFFNSFEKKTANNKNHETFPVFKEFTILYIEDLT